MPLNSHLKLVDNILDTKSLQQAPTRNGYGEGLVQAADEDPAVVALCAGSEFTYNDIKVQ